MLPGSHKHLLLQHLFSVRQTRAALAGQERLWRESFLPGYRQILLFGEYQRPNGECRRTLWPVVSGTHRVLD